MSYFKKIFITDGTDDLGIWSSGGITSIKAVHYRIKNSKEWFSGHCWTAVADGASVYFHIKSGAKTVHGVGTVSSDAKCYIYLYEAPTLTNNGTGLTEYCMNRETDVSPTAAMFRDPAVSDDGTELACEVLGTAGKFTATGGVVDGAYWILDHDKSYLIKVTNKSGTNSDISVGYEWHEHVAV